MDYNLIQGDCIPEMLKLAEQGYQYDLSIFSPPFASLYAYSDQDADMGNSRDSDDEFILHHKFFVNALYPLAGDGTLTCVHVQNVVRKKAHEQSMGIYDLRGEIIRQFIDAGFIFYGETTIRKNPQAQSIVKKVHQLMFSNFHKDSTISRPAMLDYLLIFKKKGKRVRPVKPSTNFPNKSTRQINDVWIKWADAVWDTEYDNYYLPYVYDDINETNTLNTKAAKENNDERHVCPLQLDLIERALKLYSNPNEKVFIPFAGIGSELYMSIIHDRKPTGIELKKSYFEEAERNCKKAIHERQLINSQQLLFV